MKKIILAMSLALAMINLQSQNYLISFAGTGVSTKVDSVIVQNLSQCTSLKLVRGDILNLVGTIGIKEITSSNSQSLYIYPNPFTEYSIIEFESPVAGNVTIEIYDITGKSIIQTKNHIQQGKHKFQISGIIRGVYTIQINSELYSYTGKLLCNGNGSGNSKIIYQNQSIKTAIPVNNKKIISEKLCDIKGTTSTIQMQYNTGDRLKITGISGLYRTIYMLVPSINQTVTFNFMECNDRDGNYYTVVQIGTQVWMAENLKTTKYLDGTSIPNVTDNTTWGNLTTGAYCDYNNKPSNSSIYGRLYNFYAATDAHNICPTGWHVPTDIEWTFMTTYLGSDSLAGGKLKENCSTRWLSPNKEATNETGFTALPGGCRYNIGTFDLLRLNGYWWGSTQTDLYNAWFRNMSYDLKSVSRRYDYKSSGFSVRCLKD
jgi:uncharacterized protein (TIGR02145 family)